MTEAALTLDGEILVPHTLMQGRDVEQIERLLHKAGVLPVMVQKRRWRLDAERSGYVLSFSFTLTLTP